MSQAQAATEVDRLPWLPDEPRLEPKTEPRGNRRELIFWAIVAALMVAAAAYWLGGLSWQQPRPSSQPYAQSPSTTMPVPQPTVPVQQPQVVLDPAPQVTPPPAREVPLARPRPVKPAIARRASGVSTSENAAAALETMTTDQQITPAAEEAAAPSKAEVKPLKAWPASQSQGAKGRIVRVGAFGSRQQAKLGWRYMVRAYPAVAHLKATVVADRNSRGRRFYRFQIGTTSQAHSEVLCQRMDKIRLSCAVVGLALDPKGVER